MSEYVKLEDVCEILDSQRVPITASDRVSGIYPYYGANGIQDYVDKYIFDDELVLLAEDGGNFGSKDRPIAYRVSGKCWVNNHAHVLKPNKEIDVDYLCYSLMFYDTSKLVNGATRQKLNQSAMRQMKIPFVLIEEQKEIVFKLNLVTDLIDKHKKQLQKLDELVKARFVELFGDPVSNPYGWEKISLCELADIKIGPFGSLIHKEEYIEGGYALINPSNIIDGKISIDTKLTVSKIKYDELNSYHLRVGDLILGRRGEMGRCAIVEKEGLICGTGSLRIRTKGKVTSDYLQKIISFPSFKKTIEDMAVGQTMPNLNVSIVSGFQIIMPPLEVQQQYYSFIELIDGLKTQIQENIEKIETLKKALMQKYFE